MAYALRCSPLPAAPSDVPGVTWELEEMGRARPDGVELRWRDLVPMASEALMPLPFFIEDLTPVELRVPPEAAEGHRLPVNGIAGLRVAVAHVQATARHLGRLLGAEPQAASAPDAARFVLEAGETPQVIELVGADYDSHAAEHLARLGEGPCEVRLAGAAVGAGDEGGVLSGPTHGVRFVLGGSS